MLPPWTCSVCRVTCTSQETLLGHAAGAKHKRRVRECAPWPTRAAQKSFACLWPSSLHEGAGCMHINTVLGFWVAMQARAASRGKEEAVTGGTGAPATSNGAASPPAVAAQQQPDQNGHVEPAPKSKKRKTEQAARQDTAAAETQQPAAEQPSGPNGHAELPQQKMKQSKKRKAPADAGHAAEEAPSSTGQQQENGSARSEEKGPKWKKLAAEVLQGRKDRRMKVAKLQRKVLAAAGLGAKTLGQHGDLMLQRWSKSKQFTVHDGHVALV